MTLAQGQTGLTALEDLTLALLIATQQESAIRRIEIETNHIPELLFKSQVLGKLKLLSRWGALREPTTNVERSIYSSRFPRAIVHAPGSSARSLSGSQTQGRADGRSRHCRLAAPPGSVFKPLQALGRPTLSPATDGQEANALFSRYLFVAESFGQPQDDPGPENIR